MGHNPAGGAVIRVGVFPSDAGGCGYYRLRWSALELARQGHDVVIREQITSLRERGPGFNRLVAVKDLDCDVAVFQRVWHRTSPVYPNGQTDGVALDLLRAVQAQGVKVVVDLDDDLAAVPIGHIGYEHLHDVEATVREGCQLADVVTVSTPALAKRYGGGKAVVIPNGIPRAYLGFMPSALLERQVPVVGWTGNPTTHVGDLTQVGSVIHDLCAAGQIRFRAIGNAGELTLRDLGVPKQEHINGAPLATLEYARLYADLDVAIVPLKPSRFNAGKSNLKQLEAASLGVPVVASPTPENVRLGVGLLAERPKDWRTHLSRLCGSADLRLAMAAQGRAVAAEWTIEDRIAPMVWDAWSGARSGTVLQVAGRSTRL